MFRPILKILWAYGVLLALVNGPSVLFYAKAWAADHSQTGEVRILALGDSLTAGYNLPPGQGFPEQLHRLLQAQGYPVRVLQGGVSGDTSAGGLARLDWMLAEDPQMVIVELGANDALRGLDPQATRENLATILERLTDQGRTVILAGMLAPPNMGRAYAEEFNALYPELAADYEVSLYPFFLEGVAAQRALLLDDGIHPNAAGVEEIARRILPYVTELLDLMLESP